MTVEMLPVADADLEEAFDYYRAVRPQLGIDFLGEFRRAVDRILSFPRAWQPLDDVYRRCRLRKFPYGVIYRIEDSTVHLANTKNITMVPEARFLRAFKCWFMPPRFHHCGVFARPKIVGAPQ